jgi:hypothetical protein
MDKRVVASRLSEIVEEVLERYRLKVALADRVAGEIVRKARERLGLECVYVPDTMPDVAGEGIYEPLDAFVSVVTAHDAVECTIEGSLTPLVDVEVSRIEVTLPRDLKVWVVLDYDALTYWELEEAVEGVFELEE